MRWFGGRARSGPVAGVSRGRSGSAPAGQHGEAGGHGVLHQRGLPRPAPALRGRPPRGARHGAERGTQDGGEHGTCRRRTLARVRSASHRPLRSRPRHDARRAPTGSASQAAFRRKRHRRGRWPASGRRDRRGRRGPLSAKRPRVLRPPAATPSASDRASSPTEAAGLLSARRSTGRSPAVDHPPGDEHRDQVRHDVPRPVLGVPVLRSGRPGRRRRRVGPRPSPSRRARSRSQEQAAGSRTAARGWRGRRWPRRSTCRRARRARRAGCPAAPGRPGRGPRAVRGRRPWPGPAARSRSVRTAPCRGTSPGSPR